MRPNALTYAAGLVMLAGAGVASADGIEAVTKPSKDVTLSFVRAGRIAVLTHPDALMPSTAISEVAGEMRRILRRLSEGDMPGS